MRGTWGADLCRVRTLGLPELYWVSGVPELLQGGHWGSRLGWGCAHLLTCLQLVTGEAQVLSSSAPCVPGGG